VAERPILFSGPMVRAILEGRKTQTRRILKPTPIGSALVIDSGVYPDRYNKSDEWAFWLPDNRMTEPRTWRCPYGVPGDRLWVRETWAPVWDCPALPCCEESESFDVNHRRVAYRATEPNALEDYACSFNCDHDEPGCAPWRPSIHMYRKDSRITLDVAGVRVERLQDISEGDAKAEGVGAAPFCKAGRRAGLEHVEAFEDLWGSINGAESWAANPWVWVVEFRRVAQEARAA
jgi:hypothetical protein